MLDPATITLIISTVVGGVIAIVQAIYNLIKKPAEPPDNTLGLKKV
jgi:hypothetical protein